MQTFITFINMLVFTMPIVNMVTIWRYYQLEMGLYERPSQITESDGYEQMLDRSLGEDRQTATDATALLPG